MAPSSLLRVKSASGAAVNTARTKRNQITYRIPETANQPNPRNQTHSRVEGLRDEKAASGAKIKIQAKNIFICQPALSGGCHSRLYSWLEGVVSMNATCFHK